MIRAYMLPFFSQRSELNSRYSLSNEFERVFKELPFHAFRIREVHKEPIERTSSLRVISELISTEELWGSVVPRYDDIAVGCHAKSMSTAFNPTDDVAR